VQPGRMRRPGVVARAAMGTRPMSAAPEASRAAHSAGERGVQGRVLEVPHEGRGIEEADGGNAQAGLLGGNHVLLDYQRAGGGAAAAGGHEWTR